MLKYITIPLSTQCESFCHYSNDANLDALFISPEMLSKIILWAMKENLSIQFIYPKKPIPACLESIIESIDHIKIVPSVAIDRQLIHNSDVIVADDITLSEKHKDKIYVIRVSLSKLLNSIQALKELVLWSRKVNIVISDITNFAKQDIEKYRLFLREISDFIAEEYIQGRKPQLNIVTDRFFLKQMNNCNAGDESITVSINGKFYPCPAFIGDVEHSCGDLESGVSAPNIQLYKGRNAPICRICDAYHCKRCIWLNHKLTHEVNTPGWQQCNISHLEREASRNALDKIRNIIPNFMEEISIPNLKYLDPYSIIENL